MIYITLIALLFLPTAISRNNNTPLYLVTVTSQAVGGTTETLCAHVYQPKEPLTLQVSLQREDGDNTTILNEPVTQDFYRCIPFQVPPVVRDTVVNVHFLLQGKTTTQSETTLIRIKRTTFITLVQTDKPIYKPGQTVRFRIVSLDSSFVTHNQEYKTVEIQDPNSNRIAQWLNQTTDSGILDLFHPMNSEIAKGVYTITVWNEKGEITTSHNFEVKEYVLPKFEVKVTLPNVITILDTQVPLTVCGIYTYGKPVVGSVKAEVCRKPERVWLWFSHHSKPSEICKTYFFLTDKTKCAHTNIDVTEFALNSTHFEQRFSVQCEMEEHGTGVILKGSGSASFTINLLTITFEETPNIYKPGIAFEGKIKVLGPNSAPVSNTSVSVSAYYQRKTESWILNTDSRGITYFSLDTSPWGTEDVSLKAHPMETEDLSVVTDFLKPTYGFAHLQIKPFYSKSKSFLKLKQVKGKLPCINDGTVLANYIIHGEVLNKGQESLHFFYLVLSRGSLRQHGRLSIAVKEGAVNKGELSLSLERMSDLTPLAQVVVYTMLPNGETVADSSDVPIKMCLKNKVSLQFSSLQEIPGEKTSLSLQAHPGSLCSLRAVDQSVLLQKPEKELSVTSVFKLLPVQKLSGYPPNADDINAYKCFTEKAFEHEGSTYFNLGLQDKINDVYRIFKNVGVKILTNSVVKKPYPCSYRYLYYDDRVYYYASEPLAERFIEMKPVKPVAKRPITESIRTYFPETWIWDLVSVGGNGSVTVEKTLPDTITKWGARAFCTSSVGFGLSASTEITAFQPFFVSLTLPYSIIRGEVLTLKATVFNYLSKCIMVKVTLVDSAQFLARPCEGCQYTMCLCADESRTFSWIFTSTTLGEVSITVRAEALKTDDLCGNEVVNVPEHGRVDTVVRTLLVEAEGTQQTIDHNALLCPTVGGAVEKSISLKLPEVFVNGSAKASLSVLGDLMGRATKNLDSLLRMPYGCGEQNMILFAPNIYILNYLRITGQLTQDIKNKAIEFLTSGYQRELNYKHDDGSYSAFGKNDESGNTWLTSFVMKSFGGARQHIFVDLNHIRDAKAWLSRHQMKSGCVSAVGKLFHNGMKGGVNDEVSLTAYIAAGLLELERNTEDPVVVKCLNCLKAATEQLNNSYTMALLSYTFTLAGDHEMRIKLIAHLDKQATRSGGTLHWERAEASGTKTDSLEVEMTSYVLLALLSGPLLPEFGLGYSASIVRWLAQQQNTYGGFASTQDTVVALQALAKYSAVTYSPEGDTAVAVTSADGFKREFTVNQHNRLLYQEQQLQEVTGDYNIKAEGKGCVVVQISMQYNIPPPPDYSTFNISTRTTGKCNETKPSLTVSVDVIYTGKREETNMVIINVKLLSGFLLEESSLIPLRGERTVKRVDKEDGHVIIYLDGLKRLHTQTYNLALVENVPVMNLKPAVVKVYDYYQTSDEAVTEYSSPCAKSDAVNAL